MFILRQVFKSGGTQNRTLGSRYQIVRKEEEPEQFKEIIAVTDHHPDAHNIFAVIYYDRGYEEKTYPLYDGHHYYIMTETGKTFERIRK